MGLLMRMRAQLIAWLALLALGAAPRHARADKPPRSLVVVVAKGSMVKNLTRAELRRCFSSEAVVIEGARLVPFNYPPGSPERLAFDQIVLGMSGEQVGRFWVDRKIRGESQAPRALPPSAITKIVTKFPAAISYVPIELVTDAVVAVTIEGSSPTSPGYPIKVR
ncbi:MAG: hypothetical protein NT062_19280 [Proteobacteria bacterium]|nr:hypothetical protein [Pseudomonadota bacterium]